jgi:DNA polymerase-3 subunit chi
MGAVFFYHLTSSPLEVALPPLLEKSRGAGWRVLVRMTSPERLDWLDQRLWLTTEDGFLAHGMAGGPHDADQPILLTMAQDNANSADCIMAVDGAELSEAEAKAAQRACVLFDGNDPAAVDAARSQWKRLTAAGCPAQYWAQQDGRWVKKSETG